MTEQEFMEKEIKVWGIDYISDLCDKGFEPQFIDNKWRWVLPVKVAVRV